jgi:hypothetical protein
LSWKDAIDFFNLIHVDVFFQNRIIEDCVLKNSTELVNRGRNVQFE